MIEADIEVLFVVKTSGFRYSQRFAIHLHLSKSNALGSIFKYSKSTICCNFSLHLRKEKYVLWPKIRINNTWVVAMCNNLLVYYCNHMMTNNPF